MSILESEAKIADSIAKILLEDGELKDDYDDLSWCRKGHSEDIKND